MGTFRYDTALSVDFDDRLLLHLQVVISAKLRRDESFMFSWTRPADEGGGRTSIWIDRHVPLTFEYTTSSMPGLNRRWIDDLAEATYRAVGLQIVPEPGIELPDVPDAQPAVPEARKKSASPKRSTGAK